jgi:hypothetical protein
MAPKRDVKLDRGDGDEIVGCSVSTARLAGVKVAGRLCLWLRCLLLRGVQQREKAKTGSVARSKCPKRQPGPMRCSSKREAI